MTSTIQVAILGDPRNPQRGNAETRETVRASDSRARFVGLDAYRDAGGRIEHDISSDEGDERAILLDPDVLDRVAADKLQQTADILKADGWKWTKTQLKLEPDAPSKYILLTGRPKYPSSEQKARLHEIDTRLFRTLSHEKGQLFTEKDEINAELHRDMYFTEAQKRFSGCLVTIEAGELKVYKGLVPRADTSNEHHTSLFGMHTDYHCSCGNWSGAGSECLYDHGMEDEPGTVDWIPASEVALIRWTVREGGYHQLPNAPLCSPASTGTPAMETAPATPATVPQC